MCVVHNIVALCIFVHPPIVQYFDTGVSQAMRTNGNGAAAAGGDGGGGGGGGGAFIKSPSNTKKRSCSGGGGGAAAAAAAAAPSSNGSCAAAAYIGTGTHVKPHHIFYHTILPKGREPLFSSLPETTSFIFTEEEIMQSTLGGIAAKCPLLHGDRGAFLREVERIVYGGD